MHSIVQWTNSNQGFITALLTFVYVVATLFLVCLAYQQLVQHQRAQRQQTRLNALASKLSALIHLHGWNNAQGKSHFAAKNFKDIEEAQKQLDAILAEEPPKT